MDDLNIILNTISDNSEKLSKILKDKGDDYANNENRFINFEKMAHLLDMPIEKVFIFYMSIKIARLTELYKDNKTPVNESIDDTLIDLIGYTTLFQAYNKKRQGEDIIDL